jgi:chorismate synthase
MMSINAVKGVEIGEGMAAAALTGVENADEIRMGPEGPEYLLATTRAASWAGSPPGSRWCAGLR